MMHKVHGSSVRRRRRKAYSPCMCFEEKRGRGAHLEELDPLALVAAVVVLAVVMLMVMVVIVVVMLVVVVVVVVVVVLVPFLRVAVRVVQRLRPQSIIHSDG